MLYNAHIDRIRTSAPLIETGSRSQDSSRKHYPKSLKRIVLECFESEHTRPEKTNARFLR
jgi:hypothetical protein